MFAYLRKNTATGSFKFKCSLLQALLSGALDKCLVVLTFSILRSNSTDGNLIFFFKKKV